MQNVLTHGASIWDLEQWKVSWVLLREYVELDRLPILGEALEVLTYPAGFDRLYAYRDFHLFDQDQQLVGRCSSAWMLLHLETRRVSRIPGPIHERFIHQVSPGSKDCLPQPNFRLPALDRVDAEQTFRVGTFDLDFNSHLNNVLYVQWMLECRPPDFLATHFPKRLELTFRREAVYGQHLLAREQQIDPERTYLHHLQLSGGEAVGSMRSYWVDFP